MLCCRRGVSAPVNACGPHCRRHRRIPCHHDTLVAETRAEYTIPLTRSECSLYVTIANVSYYLLLPAPITAHLLPHHTTGHGSAKISVSSTSVNRVVGDKQRRNFPSNAPSHCYRHPTCEHGEKTCRCSRGPWSKFIGPSRATSVLPERHVFSMLSANLLLRSDDKSPLHDAFGPSNITTADVITLSLPVVTLPPSTQPPLAVAASYALSMRLSSSLTSTTSLHPPRLDSILLPSTELTAGLADTSI